MLSLIFLLNFCFARPPNPELSSLRKPHTDYRFYLQERSTATENDAVLSRTEDLTEEPWKRLPLSSMPQDSLQILFESIRDTQPMTDSHGHLRRATWFYPDDGCYARSAIAQKHLNSDNRRRFHQIFIFGNLSAKTDNHPDGQVQWWYHVAPIINTSYGTFVFDPALEMHKPIRVDQWIDQMLTDRTDAKVSLCSPSAFSPESPCFSEDPIEYERALAEEQDSYLDLEWERLESLGRDPNKILGDRPPWAIFSKF